MVWAWVFPAIPRPRQLMQALLRGWAGHAFGGNTTWIVDIDRRMAQSCLPASLSSCLLPTVFCETLFGITYLPLQPPPP